MKIFELTIACLLIAAVFSFGNAHPAILTQAGANGTAIVHAVITVIESGKVFNFSDHRFLRRLAYVTSNDGTAYCDDDGSGIWGIDEDKLDAMRQYKDTVDLTAANNRTEMLVGLSILEAEVEAVQLKPLYCGAAANLYLYYLMLTDGDIEVPLAHDIAGQADLWVKHFCVSSAKRSCFKEYFVYLVTELERKERK